jgi:type IV pilus assembly protein PilX
MNNSRNRSITMRARQQGVVLFIALIVLVAMTLAGLAIMRSVDTGNLVAGNVAFRQAALSSADGGFDTAFTWLKANVTTGALDNNSFPNGYYATAYVPVDWTASSAWNNAKVVGTDANGNAVSYVISRLCANLGAYDATCASGGTAGGTKNNFDVGSNAWTSPPVIYFRVTVRVDGPRSTLSIVQSNIALQM